MSIPPVPNHPPRPGRRRPAEESPDSITTQLFIGQDKSPAADGSTQALSPEELARLRSMVSSDEAEATEVLSLDELRQLAAAENDESGLIDPAPRKVRSEDIAEAEAASAPKQWNPQGDSVRQAPNPEPSPNPEPWGGEFGAPGPPAPQTPPEPRPADYPRNESHVPNGASAYSPHAAPAYPGHSGPGPNGGGYGHGGGAGGPTGPNGGGYGPGGYGPGGYGPGGPAGPGGPYQRDNQTKKVPGWLWVLAAIALVIALGIVGYIAWDATQSNDDAASGTSSQGPSDGAGAETEDPKTSAPPVAAESFKSPSGNISCTIDSDRTRCVISSFDYTTPEKPGDCQMENWGAVVVANDQGAGFSCRKAPENSGPARVLGYGESISAEGMTCTSTREGMTCKSDETGVGFNMRRAAVDFLD